MLTMLSFNLNSNEKLIKVFRKSEATLFKPAFLILVFIYFPIWFLFKYELIQKFAWVLALWTLIVLMYAVSIYLLWLVNVSLITDQRVVNIEYHFLFRRQIEEMLIIDIANIRQNTTGIFSSFFKFGSLELQGGGMEPLRLLQIPAPMAVKDLLWQLKTHAVSKNQKNSVK
jgi:hypothetical protein